MSKAIERYIDQVITVANIRDEQEAAKVRAEQRDHLEVKVERLTAAGMKPEDAVFQAIDEHGDARVVGYGLRPKFPWVDVRVHGMARGFIAIGPRAVGVFAFGGVAAGVVAIGGIALGAVSFGGLALGLLLCWAALGIAPVGFAFAGIAVGLIAIGGVAVGAAAGGIVAVGLLASGNIVLSLYDYAGAPGWLQVLPHWVPDDAVGGSVAGVLLVTLLLLFFGSWYMQHREARRVRAADPLAFA